MHSVCQAEPANKFHSVLEMPKSYEGLLRKGYELNRDFFVGTGNLENVDHCLLVVPHTGSIEPRTKDILLAVAKLGKWAYCVFEGRLPSDNYRRLHITSTGFDEPGLLELLPQTRFVLSFHGARRRCHWSMWAVYLKKAAKP